VPLVQNHCDELLEFKGPTGWADEWDERARQQLAGREKYEREGTTEHAEYRKAVVKRIKGELRGHGFQFKGDTKPAENHWKQFSADDLLAKYPKAEP
jgi:hypothetical protein